MRNVGGRENAWMGVTRRVAGYVAATWTIVDRRVCNGRVRPRAHIGATSKSLFEIDGFDIVI